MKLPLAFGKEISFDERLSATMSEAMGKTICLVVSPVIYDPYTFIPRFAILEELTSENGLWYKRFETMGDVRDAQDGPEEYIPYLVAQLINEYTTQEKFK